MKKAIGILLFMLGIPLALIALLGYFFLTFIFVLLLSLITLLLTPVAVGVFLLEGLE